MNTQVEKISQAPIHHEMPCMYQLYNIVDAIDANNKAVKIKQPSRMVCKADLEREITQLEARLTELKGTLTEVVALEKK